MHELIRFEQPPLDRLLMQINLRATPEERQLSAMLRACAEKMRDSSNPQLLRVFSGASVRAPSYSVLGEADRGAYENLLGELGRTGLDGQLKRLDQAHAYFCRREEEVGAACAQRARLIRTLGVTGGAAAFLLLI